MTSEPTPYGVARVADGVFASIEEFVHGIADQSDASFILGTALQTYAIEHTVYKRQAIGSWRSVSRTSNLRLTPEKIAIQSVRRIQFPTSASS